MDTLTQTNGHDGDVALERAELYELEGVSKVYGSGATRVTALTDISLSIKHGEFVAVAGDNDRAASKLVGLRCRDVESRSNH